MSHINQTDVTEKIIFFKKIIRFHFSNFIKKIKIKKSRKQHEVDLERPSNPARAPHGHIAVQSRAGPRSPPPSARPWSRRRPCITRRHTHVHCARNQLEQVAGIFPARKGTSCYQHCTAALLCSATNLTSPLKYLEWLCCPAIDSRTTEPPCW
jgi:hypothetical protein